MFCGGKDLRCGMGEHPYHMCHSYVGGLPVAWVTQMYTARKFSFRHVGRIVCENKRGY